jgi:hypothetical protein
VSRKPEYLCESVARYIGAALAIMFIAFLLTAWIWMLWPAQP